MHEKAKQRIAEAKSTKDTRPSFVLPKKGRVYDNFKDGIAKLCDTVLTDESLSSEERNSVAWLKSRIEIEM